MTAPGEVRKAKDTSAEWQTPPEVFDALWDIFHCTIDIAASDENHLLPRYITQEMDAFKLPGQGWLTEGFDVWWCNPPYGRDMLRWIHLFGLLANQGFPGIALVPANTEVEWFRLAMNEPRCHECWLIYPRISFLRDGVQVKGNSGPNALLVYEARPRPGNYPVFKSWSWK